MFELEILNLITNKVFKKVMWNEQSKNNFVRKCFYSKKVKILSISDYSRFYD